MKRSFFAPLLLLTLGPVAFGQSANEQLRDAIWLQKNPMAYQVQLRGQVPPVSDEVLGVFRSYDPGSKTLKPIGDIVTDLKTIHPIMVAIDSGLASAVPRLLDFNIDPDGVTGKFEPLIDGWNGDEKDCAISGVLGYAVAYYVEHFIESPYWKKQLPSYVELSPPRSAADDVRNAICAITKFDRNTRGMVAAIKLLNQAKMYGDTTELRDVIMACAKAGRPKRNLMPVYSFRPRTLPDGSVVMETYQLSEAEVETIPPSLIGPQENQVRDQWWLRR